MDRRAFWKPGDMQDTGERDDEKRAREKEMVGCVITFSNKRDRM